MIKNYRNNTLEKQAFIGRLARGLWKVIRYPYYWGLSRDPKTYLNYISSLASKGGRKLSPEMLKLLQESHMHDIGKIVRYSLNPAKRTKALNLLDLLKTHKNFAGNKQYQKILNAISGQIKRNKNLQELYEKAYQNFLQEATLWNKVWGGALRGYVFTPLKLGSLGVTAGALPLALYQRGLGVSFNPENVNIYLDALVREERLKRLNQYLPSRGIGQRVSAANKLGYLIPLLFAL